MAPHLSVDMTPVGKRSVRGSWQITPDVPAVVDPQPSLITSCASGTAELMIILTSWHSVIRAIASYMLKQGNRLEVAVAKLCECCGDWFEPSKFSGNRQRFCSEECQRQWWVENRDQGKVYTFICQNCGKIYQTNFSNRDICCSRECGFEYASKRAIVEKECLSCGRVFEANQSSSDYCSDECRKRGIERVCQVCGATFYGHPNAIYCSQECELEVGRQRYQSYMTEKIGTRTYVCQECGTEFEAPYGDKRREFCSPLCRRRHHGRIHKRTRRALKKATGMVIRINPLVVFRRDRWRCGICGGKVDPHCEFPDPLSPSLDHIMPLSRGGEHTMRNLQLAHLGCNIRKRDRIPSNARGYGVPIMAIKPLVDHAGSPAYPAACCHQGGSL